MTELPTRIWNVEAPRFDHALRVEHMRRADPRSAMQVVDYICRDLAERAHESPYPPLHIDLWRVAFAVDALPTVRERHPELLWLTELAGARVVYPEQPAAKPMTMTATAYAKCACPPRDDGKMCDRGHWVWLRAELGFTADEPGIAPLVDIRMDHNSLKWDDYEVRGWRAED